MTSLFENFEDPLKGKRYLSYSQISMMLRCAKQYEYRYIKGKKIPPPGVFVQGSAYHGGLDVGYKFKKEKQTEPSKEMVQDAADKSWADYLSKEESIEWGEDKPGQLKDEVMLILEKYINKIMPNIIPLEIEVRDEIEVGNIPFVRIKDLVTEYGIIDHKLVSRKYSDSQIYSDIQSLAYLYPSGGNFTYHIAVKNKSRDLQVMNLSRTSGEERWWEDLVVRVARQIKAGIFPPNPSGWYCSPSFCGYWKMCRER